MELFKKIMMWIVIIYLLIGLINYFFMDGETLIDILIWPKHAYLGWIEAFG